MVSYNVNNILFSPIVDVLLWAFSIVSVSIWVFSSLFWSRPTNKSKTFLALVPGALVCLEIFGWASSYPLVLASLLLVPSFLFCSQSCLSISWGSALKRLIACMLLFLTFVELTALVSYNFPVAINSSIASSAFALHWNSVELSLSNSVYPILPFGYLFFIIAGIVAFLFEIGLTIIPKEKLNLVFIRAIVRLRKSFEPVSREGKFSSGSLSFALAIMFSITISSLLVVITVLPWINPTYRLVSVDAPGYYQWLVHMRGLDMNSALSFALANDRAAFVILFYFLSFFVAPVNLMQFAPALLAALFSVVSVLVLRVLCRFCEAWLYAALLLPFSLQFLGLIYSGYFGNMLAVVFVFVYFVLLLSVFRSPSSFGLFGLLGVSLLVLFSHSWTWYIFMLSLCAFLFWEWRLAARQHVSLNDFKWKLIVVGTTGAVGLVCDLSRMLLTSTSASQSVFETAQSDLSFPNAGLVLGGLKVTTNFYLGGVFANWLLLFLSIMGLFFLLSLRSEMSRLLTSWIFIGCVPLLFASGELIFNRFLFLMPWTVLSGLGLSFLVRLGVRGSKNSRRKVLFELLVLVFCLVLLLNFALRYVANINIV